MSRTTPPGGGDADWEMAVFADGAPPAPSGPPPPPEPYDDTLTATPVRPPRRRFSRILAFEGPRGYATRTTVWLRYLLFFLEILIECAITGWLTHDVPNVGSAGRWMLIAATVMLVCGALATIRHPNERNTIIREVRKYILAIALRPGTAIAVFMWASLNAFTDTDTDAFSALMHNALPIVYFCTIFIPALVFLKMVFGLGSLNRAMADNEETVRRYTRQDDLHR